jgi:DNA repair protein RadD
MLTPRPYQRQVIDDVRTSYTNKFRAPLAVVPTGGGKTVIFCCIAGEVSSRAKRVLILVHRVELLRQTSIALHKNEIQHGLISPKYTATPTACVQVASVQTLAGRMHCWDWEPDLIIVDEAHHATAGTWAKILAFYPKARVLGVTATPIRGDGRALGVKSGGIFDDLILGPEVAALIEMGFLVRPVVYAPSERLDLTNLRTMKSGDYDTRDLAAAVDKPKITGDAVSHYAKICPGTPAVVFCVNIAHAQHVADEFKAAGFTASAVDGKMDDATRKCILAGLGNGKIQVVTSCDLISEGTDIPAIGCAILLRPTASLSLYLQQVGRALRVCEGKDRAIVLDHCGNVHTHGMPDEVRPWSLDGEEKKGKKKKQLAAIKVTQCEKCFSVYQPAPVCPQCGWFPVAVNDLPDVHEGELREMTEKEVAQLNWLRNREVKNATTLEELELIEKARGYQHGWAKHRFRAVQKFALNI